MVTQEGIEPMWEDPRNKSGGRWLLNVDKKDRREVLDNCWMETVCTISYAYLTTIECTVGMYMYVFFFSS